MNIDIVGLIKHNLFRTIGVIVIGSILIGVPITFYKYSYNKGRLSQSISDQSIPSTSISGWTTTVIHQAPIIKEKEDAFFVLKLWKIRLLAF